MFNLKSLFSKSPKVQVLFDGEIPNNTFRIGNECVWVRHLGCIDLLIDFNNKERTIAAVPAEMPDEIRLYICRSYFTGIAQQCVEFWTTPNVFEAQEKVEKYNALEKSGMLEKLDQLD